jgi:RNA polymerase sigma factor (sigma-70 family)
VSDAPKPAPSAVQCPELAGFSREQMRELYELAYLVAMRITHSTRRSEDVTQTVFERLMTTRRWDPSKPIEAHIVGIVKSLISHEHVAQKSERKDAAHDGFHREVVGFARSSAEQEVIDANDDDERMKAAQSELEELEKSVAGDPVAGAVLQERMDGHRRASEIAAELGVPVDEVYRANQLLRRHLHAIRRKKESPLLQSEKADAET